jgi:hypothetical protein
MMPVGATMPRFRLKQRLPRFRLRTLLLLMLACSLLLAWCGASVRTYWFEQRVIAAIKDVEDPLEQFM